MPRRRVWSVASPSDALIQRGEKPTPNRHDCSGKHTGFLALALLNGFSKQDYINPRHPLQQLVIKTFAQMVDYPLEKIAVGIDGCSVPTFAVPLVNAALAFARLADPSRLPDPRAAALRTIFTAMTTNPELVRGPGDYDTEIMRLLPGQVVSKCGAEAYAGMGIVRGARGASASSERRPRPKPCTLTHI